ncbi:bifunctional diaminohydroxyphosphoribosylaminopyrimidine deaminase/5-amino-6-(5-phosphoribosylamino)uracil reductase RibD [Aureimonas jatrophae]|uniref:bifunctional diaminohydroxyphosphoribosylaminopyrimidine deaminase/5-amino-6-(5-phosphoribosylamino)uracil reductase RibD n=1 Tax=Aureimonas jatrophae TaxID=1166073 RepID=UPI000B84D3B9|nr:bifunctional diaminohydroxyphosphoribosylaminopyrimidine deaminase/5-amino-6-(5-phosphoribosylamino)uracil reductase RibD [Aureimonas jatrophae]MBB3949765.1 diaminohydroxyphosphoribosylaminopyrimidine deaminase/5-amino-6-(5-phosphoribosylamino)uracil reductase [Aureimonas jatrophae]
MQTESLSEEDRRYLHAASRFALRHAGLTAENPAVGCLIVRDGRIVGRGVTAFGGRPHAERVALDEAGPLAQGATAYVTLEPCAHHGRTPPCADALASAGVARVVIGANDPDPRVDGQGIERLRLQGVRVAVDASFRGNIGVEGFLTRMRRGRPFVTLKLAVSADGYIGHVDRGQVAISGAISNRQTHLLRARSDAIMVGIGTVLSDDPLLTVRLDGLSERKPKRLVIDPSLRTPRTSRLMQTAGDVPLLIATTRADDVSVAVLEPRPVQLVPFGSELDALRRLCAHLGQDGIGSILCEGGARLAASLLAQDLVDRIVIIQSRNEIGGKGVSAPDLRSYLSAFEATRRLHFGDDRWVEYDRKSH